MVLFKIAILIVVCYFIALGFIEQNSKEVDTMKEEMKDQEFLVTEAFDLMNQEMNMFVRRIKKLKEENERLQWKLSKVKR